MQSLNIMKHQSARGHQNNDSHDSNFEELVSKWWWWNVPDMVFFMPCHLLEGT